MMQNGLILCGAILGKKHIKWGDKGDRKAGEMLTLYVCPKSDNGSLDVQPVELSVASDDIPSVDIKLATKKQFDVVFMQVEQFRDRLSFKQFIELK